MCIRDRGNTTSFGQYRYAHLQDSLAKIVDEKDRNEKKVALLQARLEEKDALTRDRQEKLKREHERTISVDLNVTEEIQNEIIPLLNADVPVTSDDLVRSKPIMSSLVF